jgi:hypothetical protein
MLIWWHYYFARQHHIYSFWLDVNLTSWLFCPPTSYLLVLSPTNITSTHFTSRASRCNFGRKRYCNCFLVRNEINWVPTWIKFGIPNFGIGIPIRWLFNSGILKKFSNQNLRNRKRIGICLRWGYQKMEPKVGIPNLASSNTSSLRSESLS